MKLTLLEIVQSVLSSMDSDPVNSISDTEEALQVAQVAEEVYFQLLNDNSKDWEFLKKVRQLEALSDPDKPNYLRLPTDVSEVYWIRYEVTDENDTFTKYRTLHYRSPEDFISIVQRRRDNEDNIDVVTDFNGVDMFIKNDEHPHFYTTFDDKHITTDSYNSSVENTHQSSRSVMYCLETPSFLKDDEFVPDLPGKMFSTYLAQVKTVCFFYFKQMENPLDDRAGRRGRNVMLNKEYRTNARDFRGFGRK